MGDHQPVTGRIDELLAELTLAEKVALMGGRDLWSVQSVERLGIPSLKVTDGPNGARGVGLLGTGIPSLCIPSGTALGATWNPGLVEELGGVLAAETRARGCHVLLAPTVNLHRTPLGGRNFECMSEDPYLTGRIAVGYIRGVQAGGIGTTIKHFVANDSEFQRNTISSEVDERTLREVSMRPFQMAVQDAGAWGVMASYNRVNGTYAAENRWMLDTVLRGEWGFDGIVVSDWFGARSTGASAIAGLDLEMPGPPHWYGERLVDAVEAGEVPESVVDAAVGRLLLLAERTRAFQEPHDREEKQLDEPAHRSLARRAATEAMVLLKNDRILPLAVDRLASLAVIGPNAAATMVMGGGSAALVAQHETSPLDALVARLGDRLEICYEPGVVTDRSAQPLGGRSAVRADGGRGFDVVYFDSTDWTGPEVGTATFRDGQILHFDRAPGVSDLRSFSFRASTTYTPAVDGDHALTLVQAGRARLLVDGEVVVDGIERPMPPGDEFFGMGSAEADALVSMVAGRPVRVEVEWTPAEAAMLSGAKVGVRAPTPDDLMDRAVAVATAADAVVLVVGTSLDWETEGRDRESMDLPGDQPELIRRVCAANERTVVVVNSGSVVTSDWAEVAPAVLQIWFGGQEMADALVDVLFGDDEPSGRLPTTMPRRLEDTPAFLSYPGENGRVVYSEGLFTGYRWYEARRLPVAFPFGHGLGYTTFRWGEPSLDEIPSIAELEAGATVTVTVPVTNSGDRAGSEVVQCYVAPTSPRLTRPVRELQGFAKVRLEPGGSADVVIQLDHRAFAYWDPGDPGHSERLSRVPVAAGQGSGPRDEPGWHVDPGTYELHMGRSSADTRHMVAVHLG